jgi:hypothetical protein
MKVKIISFALVLLMVFSFMPMTVSAHDNHGHSSTTASSPIGIMCNDVIHHGNHWYYCYWCNTNICVKCYPDHVDTSSTKCSTHNLYYTYCHSCGFFHCPDSSHHVNAPQYIVCNRHTNPVPYVYCSYCQMYYCPTCYGGYHSHNSSGVTNNPFWCTSHNIYVSSSCNICGYYYCSSCHSGSHNHSTPSGNTNYFWCTVHKEYAVYCKVCQYYYCDSCHGKLHGHVLATCETPRANIKNNSEVEYGTRITLSTGTSGADIYYTTDGTSPTVNSAKYSGGITLNKNTTIRAIAYKSGMNSSGVVSFKYTVRQKISFTDIDNFPGLSNYLSILVDNKVINDAAKFNPSDGFTFDELELMLAAMGISLDGVTGLDHIDKEENLTYNDFIYILYKALLEVDYIKSPKGAGSQILKKFTYGKDITNASFYKAAFVSFYENGLLYDINFKPDAEATRVYLATALANAIINND